MQCERVRELLGPYLDQELEAESRSAVAQHLGTCPQCARAADDLGSISRQVAALGREPLPKALSVRIRTALAEAGAPPRTGVTGVIGPRVLGLVRQAAVMVVACGLTAAATTAFLSRAEHDKLMEREIVSAHVRSLLQESPIQIASSDSHAVKPWFSGRIDFSPTVKDLTAEGFALVGARLDYIGERRVAALVYRRRLHVVNVFVWPSASVSETAPRDLAHTGYNMLVWTKGGVTYWAVSDVNAGELRQLQNLL